MNNKSRNVNFILVGLIIIALAARYILLGGAGAVRLGSAAPLTGSVSQALNLGGGKISLPQAGEDYNLKTIQYFDNNSWVVASVVPLKSQFDPGTIVMQKQNDVFRVVAGPGSSFPSGYLKSLPADVGQYLTKIGVIGGSINIQ